MDLPFVDRAGRLELTPTNRLDSLKGQGAEMASTNLSPREEEIVSLCAEGLTNEAIAHRLGISVGTVNTYWLRIKLKVGGLGRTDTVVRVIKGRAEKALQATNESRELLTAMLVDHHDSDFEARATLAMFHFAMSQVSATVWATDTRLKINILANEALPSSRCGVKWAVGKTVYEIFKTTDTTNLAVAARLRALTGEESVIGLDGEFKDLQLRVSPLADEAGDIVGCISLLSLARP